MERFRWIGVLVVQAALAVSFFATAGAETCNRVVAIVNDSVITLYELNKKIKEVTGLAPNDLKSRDEGGFLDTRRQILDLIIDEKISQKKIEEIGIRVTQKQVDQAIERIKELNRWTHEDLLYRLEKDGLSFEQYVEKVKRDIERMDLINFEVKSKIIIKEDMIKQYYDEHPEEFRVEEKIHLAGIFLAKRNPADEQETSDLTEKGKEILAELKNGKDFESLVRDLSEGPMAQEGGDLGIFKSSQLGPDIQKALESVPTGGITDLIIRPNGIQILKVLDRMGGERRSMDEVREAIYDILYQMEVNQRYMSWIKELRENSYTKIIF